MTTEKQKAKQREINNKMRTYCIEHHLCVDCKNPIDDAGTIRRCSWCAKRHRLLANEWRKTWSPEKRAHVAMVQKQWRERQKEARHEANI
jgi:hypothetical protein